MLKFPELLSKAILDVSRSKVIFQREDLENDDLLALIAFKSHFNLPVLSPAKLRTIYRSGTFCDELTKLFRKNKEYGYLTQESKRKQKRYVNLVKSAS